MKARVFEERVERVLAALRRFRPLVLGLAEIPTADIARSSGLSKPVTRAVLEHLHAIGKVCKADGSRPVLWGLEKQEPEES